MTIQENGVFSMFSCTGFIMAPLGCYRCLRVMKNQADLAVPDASIELVLHA